MLGFVVKYSGFVFKIYHISNTSVIQEKSKILFKNNNNKFIRMQFKLKLCCTICNMEYVPNISDRQESHK